MSCMRSMPKELVWVSKQILWSNVLHARFIKPHLEVSRRKYRIHALMQSIENNYFRRNK